jgi:tripartite-type tricarboxylate transporter receptor subunit TctC
MGVIAPAGIPAAVLERLNREIGIVLRQPETRGKLASQLMEVVASTPEQFASTVRDDLIRWKPVIESRKIHVD